ncbi:protein kinase [Corallococcus sp. bb12-1]|uniref:serine/threonine-protein kinase n=1 Tax=Corallococcus sp. bb12-1 TaxID=2996784 RepID=UPI00226FE5D0|nr:serine/threonine-protein kinase [Corallococcus sp. bb12-1]MCY1040102.1 protein kinase [Corallococcus sp. bb12-1]
MVPSGSDEPLLAPVDRPTLADETPARPDTGGSREAASVVAWERYELLEPLGRGGMGEVHRARDRRLGRVVALKFIQGADPERAMRFLQEARAQARIDHPNVCKVFEVGELGARAYIAMQLVEGEHLDRAARALSLPEKIRVMKEAAEAVHEAHRLGVIHRDLKPSNILVTQAADGRRTPILLDFGLAYEAGLGHGLTATGEVMGTPAYMSPEQARGDLRAIDRRSDVYSLGATLHELLTGSPPFTGATPLETLRRVLHEEPAPLRARVPHLDAELETLCLKCLAKEPGQRYASARALAEDLGRYLDGVPILGRRPGLANRLKRVARRHRALVAVSSMSLVGMLLLAGFGARSWLAERELQARTAARVRLAEQLGQQVQEFEWFVRAFQTLPLHDTRPEQQRVRERLAALAAQRHDLGVQGDGLVQLALGRGLLAMREFEQAHQALTRARDAGVDTPGLHYALGRVLGERYHLALEDARRSGGAAWVAERQRGLEQAWLGPALQSLERSRGLTLESPRYLEGLIAFYRQDLAAAERAALEAVAQAPWLPEARKLAGDVAYARAMDLLERGDYPLARTGLLEAVGRYEQAVEVGRSDARGYEALAEAWLQVSELDRREGRSRSASLGRAEAAADQARVADPDRASVHTRKAQVLMNQYRRVNFQREPDARDAKTLLAQWLHAARRAVELDPRDVLAHDSLGYAFFMQGLRQARDQEAPEASWEEASRWLSRAIELQPRYPWALNDLGLVHRWRGNYQREHGQDPMPAYARAEQSLREAVRADPKYLFAHSNLTELYAAMASYRQARGQSPEEELRRARESGAAALALDGRFHAVLDHLAAAELTYAHFLFDAGSLPGPSLSRVLQQVERALELNATSDRALLHRAGAHLLEARQAMREARDPTAALARGRQALAGAYRVAPTCADCRVLGSTLELTAAEHARAQGRASLPPLQQALSEARQAVAAYPYPETHLALARACWRLAREVPPTSVEARVQEGLTQVERALQQAPELAEAHALRGALLLAGARAHGARPEAPEAVRQARAALLRAVELEPRLAREYAEPLRATRDASEL